MYTTAPPADLTYLEAELARLDILLRREVRRWALAGQDPNDDYRGMYVAQAEAEALLERPFGVSWGQWIELPAEEATAFEVALINAEARLLKVAQQGEDVGTVPRLLALAQQFHLDRTALDILVLCCAPAFDTRYERIYGYLQDNVMRRRPSVRLVLDLFGAPGSAKFALAPYVSDASPLIRYGLIQSIVEPQPTTEYWLNQTLAADETVIGWLRGVYEPRGLLRERASLAEASESVGDRILAGDTALAATACEVQTQQPVIALYGVDEERQDAAARLSAAHNGGRLLTVNLHTAVTETAPMLDIVRAALRDSHMTAAVAYLRQWDVCLDANGRADPSVLAAVLDHPGPVVLAGERSWRPGGCARTRRVAWIEMGTPAYQHRRELWMHYLQAAGRASDEAAVDVLAAQFALPSGAIRDAVLAACDASVAPQVSGEQLLASARAYSNPRLQMLATKITPRYEWRDIVLPANQQEILRELVATIRQRSRVLDEWGVGKKLASSAGVTVLFAGPPGTGKTMAAEVVTNALGLDLYKIDLSSVVSKYIGETEKNLERIFTEAASSNAILFFDEADAIFGKRSEVKDAHDRYANVEVSYLLQRMEAYDGVTILATNLRANLDEAFTRRLQFVVEFPFPRAEDRRQIWRELFPPDLPRAADLDFDLLARRYELAGGSIRNVIVAAAYLAADNGNVVTMDHLLHGVRRELRKMGRLLGEKEPVA